MPSDPTPIRALFSELSPRSRKKAEQIMRGAKSAFLELGFGGASVDEVARRASVSKGTLYSYFRDKHALFAAVVQQELEEQKRRMTEVVSSDGTIDSDLRRVVRNFLQFLVSPQPQELYRIVVAESGRFPELGRLFYSSGPELGLELIAEYLKDASERGELNVVQPRAAARIITDLCKGDFFQRSLLRVDGDFSSEDMDLEVDFIVDIILKFYGPHRGKTDSPVGSEPSRR